jgi:CSLREA domain-containing protein
MKRQIRIELTAVAIALVAMSTANAAEIVVTNNTDAVVVGSCSLRDAITAANNDSPSNGCPAGSGADTIRFKLPAPGAIILASSLPPIATAITIDGSGHSVEINGSGRSELRILEVTSVGILNLHEVTVAGGHAPQVSSITYRGGGLLNLGQATITDCTFRNNYALYEGGAIYNKGLLAVSRSTFLANRVDGGGGAIANVLPGRAMIANSTLSGNKANDQLGAAVSNVSVMSLLNCTIADNQGSSSSGIVNGGNLTMANTIVARNTPVDCLPIPDHPITAAGPNLIGDGSCTVSGAIYGDLKLGSLADNGGPTMTYALLDGSVAVDAGNDTICAADPVNNKDQRGLSRASGSHCDLGAFELVPKFAFTGFLAPLNNPPTVNTVRGGQAVPVKFSLGGNQGLNIFAPGYPRSQPMACVSGVALDEVETTVSAGGSSLSYDTATDTYTYVWKTDKAWRGCRQLIVQLSDGTFHTANFEFR